MTTDTCWNFVQKPKKVGTKKASDYKNPELTPSKGIIFNRRCGTKGEQKNYHDFDLASDEDNEDVLSCTSSCCFGTINGLRGNITITDNGGPADTEDNKVY